MLLIITRKLKNDVFELLSISFDEFISPLNFIKPKKNTMARNEKKKYENRIRKIKRRNK